MADGECCPHTGCGCWWGAELSIFPALPGLSVSSALLQGMAEPNAGL